MQHEQSTINRCVRWLHKRGETEVDRFEFRKLPRVDRGNEALRRATLTGEEYEQLCAAMRLYCIGKNGGLDTAERLQRQLVQFQHTYHHLNGTIRLNNAVADYRLDSDVTIRLV